jgi:hypothetical protein
MTALERKDGLSRRARRDARAFAEAFFSRDGDAVPGERLDHFESEISDFFGHVRGRARLLFLACLAAATWGAPLLVGRPFARLEALSVTERIDALEAMERMPVAQLALFALKALASFVYYEHPDAAAEMRWDQRCLGKKALPVVAS